MKAIIKAALAINSELSFWDSSQGQRPGQRTMTDSNSLHRTADKFITHCSRLQPTEAAPTVLGTTAKTPARWVSIKNEFVPKSHNSDTILVLTSDYLVVCSLALWHRLGSPIICRSCAARLPNVQRIRRQKQVSYCTSQRGSELRFTLSRRSGPWTIPMCWVRFSSIAKIATTNNSVFVSGSESAVSSFFLWQKFFFFLIYY